MTPKEKAEQLVDKFSDIENMGRRSDENGFSIWSTSLLQKQAKKCSLIAVDEILNLSYFKDNPTEDDDLYANYFRQVKQEIEKL